MRVEAQGGARSGEQAGAVRVSVVIPVYDTRRHLARCLDSVLNQGFEGIEVIAVDDGSVDGSREFCEQYAGRDSRVRAIARPHGGASAARNAGMDAARGKYIQFVDSDDRLLPGAIDALYRAAEEDALDIVRCCMQIEDERGARVDARRSRLPRGVMSGLALFRAGMELGAYSCHVATGMYRRSFLMEHGIRFYEGIVCEDELFTPCALRPAKRVRYIDRCLYGHTMHEDSVMHMGMEAWRGRDMVCVARKLADGLAGLPPQYDRAWRDNMLGKYFCGYTLAKMYARPFDGRETGAFALRHARGAKNVLRAVICRANGRLFCRLNAAGMRLNRRRGVVRS